MNRNIAIIGAGLIGQSWAITFARAGYNAALFDTQTGAVETAHDQIARSCGSLEELDLLSGQSGAEVCARIRSASSMEDAVDGVCYVQENTPENVEIKRCIFADLDRATPKDAVIASSTSALMPSQFTDGLEGAHRCLVAHPLNPPHLIPAVELVPGPLTSVEAMEATTDLMKAIRQTPIRTLREVEGFIMNRLQGAILDEAFALVDQGLASPQDVDAAMRDGLARRWVFMGPFETIDLNAPGGVADFIERYGPAYDRIGAHRPGRTDWSGPVSDSVINALQGYDRKTRSNWRDDRLAKLAKFVGEEKES